MPGLTGILREPPLLEDSSCGGGFKPKGAPPWFVTSDGMLWCGICALLAIATALTVLSFVGGA
jgi:hypothetical protein